MGVLRFLVVYGVLMATPALAAPTTSQVEAVFLFNFSQFVDWPAQAFPQPDSPIVIGVLGSDPFDGTLDEVVRGEMVKGRPLLVRRFQRVEQLTDCHILFISRSERPRLEPIVQMLKGRSILTVSDLDEFATQGGVIGFVLMDNKIRLRVNLQAAKEAGLTLSSKLLRPAQIVGGEAGP
jgi:YfiR/HmsC-like